QKGNAVTFVAEGKEAREVLFFTMAGVWQGVLLSRSGLRRGVNSFAFLRTELSRTSTFEIVRQRRNGNEPPLKRRDRLTSPHVVEVVAKHASSVFSKGRICRVRVLSV
ncbi:unnamed protein product, partial [Ectocarpus sp. 4 AP-2014]